MLLRAAGEGVAGSGVAVDETTGGVYVADSENHRVDEFDPSKAAGEQFVRAWGWGVQNGKAEPQVCTMLTGCRAGISGGGPGEFEGPVFIVVDNSGGESDGDVYVGDDEDDTVSKFTPEGVLVESWGTKGQLAGSTQAGSGTLTEGSATIEDAITPPVGFTVGETIEGKGIPAATTITGTPGGGILEISSPVQAGKSGVAVALTAHRSLAPLAGITISPTGTLDILTTTKEMFEFEPNDTPTAEFEVEARVEPRGLAVDTPSGGFFKINGHQTVGVLTASGQGVTELLEASFANTIASSGSELFVAEAALVRGYALSGAGEVIEPAGETFGAETLGAVAGVAVDGAAASVDVSDSSVDRVDVFAPEAVSVPLVVGESVSEVTDDSVVFAGEVNPRGLSGEAATEYYFEYGACASVGTCSEAGFPLRTPAGTLPASFEVDPVRLGEPVQGLQAGTAYHYRLVTSNGHGAGLGAEQVFSTRGRGAFLLPDGRQWQLVSPPNKQGSLIEALDAPVNAGPDGAVTQAAADGDAITYVTDAPTETGPGGSDNLVQVFSSRDASGWATRDLTVPHASATQGSVGTGQEYRAFSENLSQAAVQPFGGFTPCMSATAESQPCISPDASEQTSFLEDTATAVFTPLVTACPSAQQEAEGDLCSKGVEEHADVAPGSVFGQGVCTATNPCGPIFAGGSPGFGHVIVGFQGPSGDARLSEWSAGVPAAQQLRQVSLLPPNGAGEVLAADEPVSLGGGGGNGVSRFDVRGAVSGDGSRVVWQGEGHLFLRVNATEPQSAVVGEACSDPAMACTVQLDAGLAGQPEFQGVSSDGSRVFFKDEGGALFEYEVGHGPAVDLTPGGGVLGSVIGFGEEGGYVYFVSNAKLAAGAVSGACEGGTIEQQDRAVCNLYVLHGGATSLVAVISGADKPDWGEGSLADIAARVSPDGRWLAFMSRRSLTGYDNADAVSGRPDEEVFLFHASEAPAAAGVLVCASCNPTGARPHGVEYGINGNGAVPGMPLAGGDRVWEGNSWLAANVPGWTPFELQEAAYQSRYLSDSGRLFFDSSDGLVPKDINGTEDVYEYEPVGVPAGGDACSTAVASGSEVFRPERETAPGVVEAAGCVALISSGASAQESAFLDASESGGDVFFLTAAKLVAADYDTALDVYDAHECTSASPCLAGSAEVPPACNTEASCKAAPSTQPELFGAPPSATFSGPGTTPAPAVAKVKTAAEVRAEKLTKALRACRKDKRKRKRVACEKLARKRYGVAKRAGRASNHRGASR